MHSEDLRDSLLNVLQGRLSFPTYVNLNEPEDETKSSFTLSNEEKELLKLISQGKINKEIATILDYSVRTIESKRIRLEKKLNAKNTAELISYAYKTGILSI